VHFPREPVSEGMQVSDRAVVALAVAVVAGARIAPFVPWPVVAATVVLAALFRRPVLVVVAGFTLAAALAVHAWRGLEPPAPAVVETSAVLLSDPIDRNGAVRVELRVGRRHVDAWARGAAASALRRRLAGDHVWVRGTLEAPSERARRRLAARHIGAQLDVVEVGGWRSGSTANRAANAVRRVLERGAHDLAADERSILLGVLVGDVRAQREELTDAFRASGLSHLLVVSGGNLAFVLAVFGPGLRRLGLRTRFATTLAVIGAFGLLTRWEPSVLRACVMAALACGSFTTGRPATRVRLLALAVVIVVLVDPLLVHSLSFRLSVGATAGIALLALPIARRLPGPRWLADPLAVTVAAQVGVAPVALPAFGGLPLASIPANLLAVPAAAPLTAWGFVGGVLAGLLGPPFDGWLHLPTRLLTRWLAWVARTAAALPVGQLRATHAALLAVLGAVAWTLRSGRWSWRSVRTGSTSRRGRS
jgi:competence protein ComEC